MNFLLVKNWQQFQHYKDRNPPWIKLHRALLDDYEFAHLPDATKAHLILIWLHASQCDGQVPDDPKFLQAKLGLDKQPDLQMLKEKGFLLLEQDASPPLAERKQEDSNVIALARSREERREETEERERMFGRFWTSYPRKVAKPDASRAWKKLALPFTEFEKVMAALDAAKAAWTEHKFIPYPATWLNDRRWEDELAVAPKIQVDL